MQVHVEILHPYNIMLGFSYQSGEAESNGEPVRYHEFGIGLLLINLYFTFY